MARHIGEGAENDGDKKNGENGDGTAAPAFFAFTEKKWEKEEKEDGDDRADQKRGCLHFRREQREKSVEPEKEIIGARSGLDDGGIGTAGGAEGAEVSGDDSEREKNASAEEKIFPDSAGNEGDAVFFRELVILLDVGGFANDAAGHRPFVDAKFENHEEMKADEGDEHAGNDENMEREEA